MIQPLRTVHRSAFAALALVLPAILIVGLHARRPSQHLDGNTSQVANPLNSAQTTGISWHSGTMRSELYGDSNAQGTVYVALRPERELNEPDLLLYWVDGFVRGDSLPPQAKLLGTFVAGKRFQLLATEHPGTLILFSLADRTVLDFATVERMP